MDLVAAEYGGGVPLECTSLVLHTLIMIGIVHNKVRKLGILLALKLPAFIEAEHAKRGLFLMPVPTPTHKSRKMIFR